MKVFLFILTNNLIPVFAIIYTGYLLNNKFNLHINTLSKLFFYVFVPSFTFVNLYSSEIPIEMIKVMAAILLLLTANFIATSLLAKLIGYEKGLKNALINSVIFYNSGNFGIPLITLVFSNPPYAQNGDAPYLTIAVTTQVMIHVIQNLCVNTIGFINAGSAKLNWKDTMISVLHMPTIYVIPLAFILKLVPYDFTQFPLWPSLKYAGNALVPVALISLGAQLSKTKISLKNKDVYLSTFMRLIVSPILAYGIISILGLEGIIAQVVMISASLPTAVNTALMAVEYNNHPDFASQAVMSSTFLCSVSLVFMIFIARVLFPVA